VYPEGRLIDAAEINVVWLFHRRVSLIARSSKDFGAPAEEIVWIENAMSYPLWDYYMDYYIL
jgi:hypothetical protein